MVIVSLVSRVVGPLPNGRTSWLINGGDPNHLLTGMILQVQFTNSLPQEILHFRQRALFSGMEFVGKPRKGRQLHQSPLPVYSGFLVVAKTFYGSRPNPPKKKQEIQNKYIIVTTEAEN